MFYGQMCSVLECLTCEKKSTTNDVFTNIPLSLPEPSKLLLNIVIHRLPSSVKNAISTITPNTNFDSTMIGDE